MKLKMKELKQKILLIQSRVSTTVYHRFKAS